MTDIRTVGTGKPLQDSLAYLSDDEREAVQRITDAVKDIPLLPVTGTQLTAALSNPNVSAQQVAAIIARDPVVAAKTLRLANSAYYGIPNRISTLNHAISMLGVDSVRQMVFSFYFLDMTAIKSGNSGYDMDRFWRHSMAVAFLAEAIARRLGFQMTGAAEAYLAGLVHDLGKYLLFRYNRDAFIQARQQAQEGALTPVVSESRVFGTDHAAIGGWLAERWNLPLGLIETTRLHHRPIEESVNKELIAITMAADRLAIDNGCAYEPDRRVDPLDPEADRILRSRVKGIQEGEGVLDRLRQILDPEFQKLEHFLASFEGAPATKPDDRPRIETKAMELSAAQLNDDAPATDKTMPRNSTVDSGNLLISFLLPGIIPLTKGATGKGAGMFFLFVTGLLMVLLSYNINNTITNTGVLLTGIGWLWSVLDCIRMK